MNIQQLEYIVALDDHRHFVDAAESCHITQPTLTMQVRKMEDEIGVQIFNRSRKPIEPTPAGEEIIIRARQILREISDLRNYVSHEKKSIEGEFRLGIIPTLAPYLIPRFLPQFISENPNTHLRIEELESEQLLKALHNDRIDIGLMVTPTEERQIREIPLFYEPFLFYAPYDHPYMHNEFIEDNLLDPAKVLVLTEGHCFRNQTLDICGKANQTNNAFGFYYESGSIEALKAMVRKGIGYTLVPELSVDSMTDRPFVRRFTAPEPVREVSIVVHQSFTRQLLIDQIKSAVLDNLPDNINKTKSVKKIKWR
ncbi:LysR substrate-binding domain-containing protein [Marinilabilia salmonicolor]|jgi:LysR family hydrogen peroxide-inducible transcriptional activator|uniref:LysR family hydrogen peroxide-inducible transcriptional activator n=1 Tax=Marinilabilia salmonicolor TaxID=989 RepID=A0A368V4V4_9BACT|nr:LysR substrate-binding domain-containing protein [Marinilabilia salmonicolor]RCW36109.1 LysR family hydrogen peroxide-inducible transcriptional activator [Marinilabilia salmonicolor]